MRRLVPPLAPLAAVEPDGLDLWGGGRREGPELETSPSYLLIGSVPGDVDVRVGEGAGGRPVTGSSTEVLPGVTVFYDLGPGDGAWDPGRLAPLTFDLGEGRTAAVRERSYES